MRSFTRLSCLGGLIFSLSNMVHADFEAPICMAEKRHNNHGADLTKGAIMATDGSPINLEWGAINADDEDPILIGGGIPTSICGQSLHGDLKINESFFIPKKTNSLINEDFVGLVTSERKPKLDVSIYNIRHNNGHPIGNVDYDDSCSLTSMIEFRNRDDDEQDIRGDSGITFNGLLESNNDGSKFNDFKIISTSSGDAILDELDTWVIFASGWNHQKVILVELLGHRQGDFRDVLQMELRGTNEQDLFIGLRKDYELNEEEVDGEVAYLQYTITTFDSSTDAGYNQMRKDISNCFQAADLWAKEFIRFDSGITPVVAADMVARSQCFSNSSSQQKWQDENMGFWSMNTIHGVAGNVFVNAGILEANAKYSVYIQKFDETFFKGPRTFVYTDSEGRVMTAIPTIVEGDKVKLLRAKANGKELNIDCVANTSVNR